MADDVSLIDLQRVHQRDDVGAGEILAIARRIVWYVRRRIAALAESHAAIIPTEPAHLRLPGAVVAGKFMDEDDRRPGAGLLVVEVHAIGGFDFGHSHLAACWTIAAAC